VVDWFNSRKEGGTDVDFGPTREQVAGDLEGQVLHGMVTVRSKFVEEEDAFAERRGVTSVDR
jgi:hypothetical protein